MNRRRNLHIFTSLSVAAAISAAVFSWDDARQRKNEALIAQAWARQLTAQAESLALGAREKGEKDPISFATHLMSQSPEPRMMKMTKFSGGLGGLEEMFAPLNGSGIFEYSKIFSSEAGTGFRLQIFTGHQGFLGAKTLWGSDLSLFAFFSLIAAFLFFATGRFFGFKGDSSALKRKLLEWTARAKETVTLLGTHIRELVKEAHGLTEAAARSRDAVFGLREKLYSKVNAVHEGRTALRETQQALMQAETHALNLIAEATRLGPQGGSIGKSAGELHAQLRKIGESVRLAEKSVRQVEIELEPWCTDADTALQSYEGFFDTTRRLSQHIRSTTQSILDHSKMMKDLRSDTEEDSA